MAKKKDSPDKVAGLVHSLNLIPYLHRHPHATPMEIARDLGQTHEDVMEALKRLQFSGRSKGPGELFDIAADWTGITVIDDQGLNTALRLTPNEANALLLTLESLETMPGLIDDAAVASAAAKIRAVVKGAGVEDAEPAAETGAQLASQAARTIAQALEQRRQVQFTYYSASSDTTTQRTVSPQSLFHRDGNTYLKAREVGGEDKSFRLDRIRAVGLLDAPADTGSRSVDASDPFGFHNREAAELLIRSEATWLADYWHIELHPELDPGDSDDDSGDTASEGWVRATMPYGNHEWLIRFCLSQADRIRVVSPASIREEIARRGNDGLEAYA